MRSKLIMPALFNLGFRPFFLGAAMFAMVSMAAWTAVYSFHLPFVIEGLSPSQWHAHEMLYGYAIAVIAGFLLTATRNWTGLPTPQGVPLALLFALWAAARILLLPGSRFLYAAAAADLLFTLLLFLACAMPIIRARQWKQMAVLSKLLLLGTGNALFYAGVFGMLERGVYWGLYGGLYLVIALILTMGRRLIPFFIERGVSPPVTLRNSKWLDISSLVLLLVFWIADVFLLRRGIAATAAGGVFLVNGVRLAFWYTPGIWRRPLLWSLYVAFALIDAGFLVYVLSVIAGVHVLFAIHTFAIGGIGLMTLSMMARVALGHTGRSVHQPPAIIVLPLMLVLLSVMVRVVFPVLAPQYYANWIIGSQAAWVAAFAVFAAVYLPILARPRIDGAPG